MSTHLTEEARSFLEAPRFAVLATINRNGTPQQSTVWYELQGDEIMMNTRRGRVKDRNLRRDPRCSVCVQDGYRYVTIRGTVRFIDDQEPAHADIRHLAIRYHGQEKGEQETRDVYAKHERATLRMSIDRVDEYGF